MLILTSNALTMEEDESRQTGMTNEDLVGLCYIGYQQHGFSKASRQCTGKIEVTKENQWGKVANPDVKTMRILYLTRTRKSMVN